eukprot:767296-Hanusia_phi.AAC.2
MMQRWMDRPIDPGRKSFIEQSSRKLLPRPDGEDGDMSEEDTGGGEQREGSGAGEGGEIEEERQGGAFSLSKMAGSKERRTRRQVEDKQAANVAKMMKKKRISSMIDATSHGKVSEKLVDGLDELQIVKYDKRLANYVQVSQLRADVVECVKFANRRSSTARRRGEGRLCFSCTRCR